MFLAVPADAVILRIATFEDEATTESPAPQGYQKQYVYFDRKWGRPRPWAVSIQRMKYSLLALFGRTDYATSNLVLEVEAPRECPAAESIDWRPSGAALILPSLKRPPRSNCSRVPRRFRLNNRPLAFYRRFCTIPFGTFAAGEGRLQCVAHFFEAGARTGLLIAISRF